MIPLTKLPLFGPSNLYRMTERSLKERFYSFWGTKTPCGSQRNWGPVYTGPDKSLHGQKLAQFHLAFTRDRRNWTNFWTAKAPFTRVRTNFCTDEFCSWIACLHGSVQILLQWCLHGSVQILDQLRHLIPGHNRAMWAKSCTVRVFTRVRMKYGTVPVKKMTKLAHFAVQKFVQFRRSHVNARWNRASFCPCKELSGPV